MGLESNIKCRGQGGGDGDNQSEMSSYLRRETLPGEGSHAVDSEWGGWELTGKHYMHQHNNMQ